MADTTSRRNQADAGELRSVGEQASAAVRQATQVLETELAGGLEEARRVQRRLLDERRLERGDLDELAERVRRTTHELIDMLADRVSDLRQDDVQDLASRLTKDAHEAFDAVMDLVEVAPSVVNRLVEVAGAAAPGERDEAAPKAAPTAKATSRAPAKRATKKAATTKKAAGTRKAPAPGSRARKSAT